MTVVIRPALPSDLVPLAQLFARTREAAFPWLTATKVKSLEKEFQDQTAGETVFVAADKFSSSVVGFVSVWEPARFLHHLYVSPERQGEGIGSQLLASITSRLPPPYQLKCLVQNRRARAFYQRHGWYPITVGQSAEGDYELLEWSNRPDRSNA
ncbi:GNAT family N-acetyltransferase [Hymenobacter busanensis]|nr:GNAT family N-acetyltransferase [Hymenobacter busanensis]QHJ06235.1 GNAT family N-acetyltransferase [Hymenobacter busanensis]